MPLATEQDEARCAARIEYRGVEPMPKVNLTRKEFRERAVAAGWKAEMIESFLKEPLTEKYVRVGNESVRVLR